MQRIRMLKFSLLTTLAGPAVLAANCLLSGDDVRNTTFNSIQGFITGLVTTGLDNVYAVLFPT